MSELIRVKEVFEMVTNRQPLTRGELSAFGYKLKKLGVTSRMGAGGVKYVNQAEVMDKLDKLATLIMAPVTVKESRAVKAAQAAPEVAPAKSPLEYFQNLIEAFNRLAEQNEAQAEEIALLRDELAACKQEVERLTAIKVPTLSPAARRALAVYGK